MPKKRLTDFVDLEQKIKELKPGDHLCCIYKNDREHRALLTPFMRQGLDRGEKIIYVVDAHSAEQILSYLREDGLDVEDYLKNGQLNVLSVDESYMLEGVFDPDGMICLLEKETMRALDEGYSALRLTGEMSWTLRGLPGSERLMEYESKLNTFFSGNKCLAICQYDKRRFESAILLEVLTTHPIAIIGTEVFDNYYYISPKELLYSDQETARLDNWLLNLKARKVIDQTLRESELMYRTLVENSCDVVYSITPDGIITFVSPQMRHFGYSPEEVISKRFLEFVVPEMRQMVLHEFERGTTKGESFPIVFQWQGKDGRRYWVEVIGKTSYDESGHPLLQTGMMRDVTEQKHAEEALKESEKTARAFLNASTDSGVLVDREGLIIDLNDKMAKSLGKARKDMIGKIIYDYLPADLAEQRKAIGFEAATKRKPIRFEDRREDRWLENSVYPILNPNGEAERFAIFSRDITERKQAQEEIAGLARLPAENPNPVLRISKEARILFANKASDIVLETWQCRVGETIPEPCFGRAKEVFQSGKVFTFEFNCHDGTILLVTLAPIVEEGYLNAYGVDITELKRAQEEFRNARDEWERTFESVPDLIFILDMNCRIVRINNTAVKRLGCTKEEIVGRFCYEVIHGEKAPPEFCLHTQLLADGQEHFAEVREEQLNGDFSISVTPLRDADGKLVGAVHVAHDITEHIRTEETLKIEKEFTETALNAQTDTFFVFEPSTGRAIRWNEAFGIQSGYGDEEIRSKKAPDSYYSKDDLGKARAAIAKILDGETTTVELNLITKDGRTIPTEYTGSVITDSEGAPRYIITVGRDITERRQSEQVLKQSEKRFRALVEGLGQGYFVFMHDMDGNVKYLSPAVEALIGVKPDQLIGRHWKEYVEWTEETLAAGVEFGRKIRETGQPLEPFIMSFKSGSDIRYVEIAERPTLDDTGNVIGIEGIAKEVTEEVRATKSLRRIRDELEMRVEERTAQLTRSREAMRKLAGKLLSVQEEERRRLARELHDDLTQRLAVLAIDIGKLERKLDSSPELLASMIKKIRERTVELSTDIHDISRQLHPAILDDLGLRQAIQSECTSFTKREGIAIRYESKDIPPMIPRDLSVCFFRIVQEALRNIAKYAKVKEASVSLVGGNENITLVIRDSGAGFDMARSASERGVGLASMQERVRSVKGDFSIESEPGQGTVIRAVAPLQGK
jgi:PAS domain S-box-containing protein